MTTTNLAAGTSGYVLTCGNDGTPAWATPPMSVLPTVEELGKYPTLKSTWEEYLMTRKLLGL